MLVLRIDKNIIRAEADYEAVDVISRFDDFLLRQLNLCDQSVVGRYLKENVSA